jgi:Fe-S cluster assembly ATP-binding protein
VLARDAVVSIFDEPEAGVDLWTIQRLLGLIIRKYQEHPQSTAIIITHNENVLPICDEIIVVEDGQVTMQGSSNQIWPFIKSEIECKIKDQCRGEMGYAN